MAYPLLLVRGVTLTITQDTPLWLSSTTFEYILPGAPRTRGASRPIDPAFARPGLMQQTHERGSAPRNSLDTPHIHDIKSHGLSELLHLGTGNAGDQRACREVDSGSPAMAPLSHMLEGRPAGVAFYIRLNAVRPLWTLNNPSSRPSWVGESLPGNLIIEMLMYVVTHMTTTRAVLGAKRWQFKTSLNETLDGHIDEISRITHRVGRLLDLMRHRTFAAVRIRRDLQIGTNREAVTVAADLDFNDRRYSPARAVADRGRGESRPVSSLQLANSPSADDI